MAQARTEPLQWLIELPMAAVARAAVTHGYSRPLTLLTCTAGAVEDLLGPAAPLLWQLMSYSC